MCRIIEKGALLISCLFLLWLVASWLEVASKNTEPTYNSWNAWVLLTDALTD